MSNKRIPNHRIDSFVADLEPFTNYNGTICGFRQTPTAIESRDRFIITHWNTVILELNLDSKEIEYLYPTVYSQTTSRLIGRIIRNLPRASVERFLARLATTDPTNAKRLSRMAGI